MRSLVHDIAAPRLIGPGAVAGEGKRDDAPASTITRLRWPQWLFVACGLLLLWPALINGAPFLHADTTSYIRAADSVALRVTGQPTSWTSPDVRDIVGVSHDWAARGASEAAEIKPILLGRSIYYGLFTYVGVIGGSLWLVIILQALAVGAVLLGFTRHIIDPADQRRFALCYLALIGALAVTPLAYFTSNVMPDVFTGISIVAATMLIAGWRREQRAGRWVWAAVASYGALVHSSHVLILSAMAIGAFVLAWRVAGLDRRGAIAVFAAACIGFVGETAFALSVTAATGSAPIRPPFMTARLVDDGPGTAYLKAHCDQPRFVLCAYRDRLPLPSDDFLWRTDRRGVFKAVSPDQQRALSEEQGRFVRSVVADRPLDVLGAMVGSVWRQAGMWQLPEFTQDPGEAASIASKLSVGERDAMVKSAAYRGVMPTGLVAGLVPVFMILAVAAVFAGGRSRSVPPMFGYMVVILLGWIADIVICGALSTPHHRYQARVVWLAALLIALYVVPRLTRRRAA